jgi:DNA-binding MarR family transcriptional regulator/N-acetylglutamate synthase-like GNAT family acetyltransferase
MNAIAVAQVRSFNRTVTQRIGALNDRFLDRDRPLGASRVLFEIGREGAGIRELRAKLELDSGYLSRLLRALERQGLIELAPDPADRRVRRARLMPAGKDEFALLDRRSDQFATSLLASLTEAQRQRLLAAMTEVERLLLASGLMIEIEDPRSAAAGWCLTQYFDELGARFETGFDPGRSIPADADQLIPPAGVFLLARSCGQTLGCGALKTGKNSIGEIKRMWVAPAGRGLGVGRRLLAALEDHARRFGLTVLHLETNRTLHEAQALYRGCGYREVPAFNAEPYAHHWFEKRLPAAASDGPARDAPPDTPAGAAVRRRRVDLSARRCPSR